MKNPTVNETISQLLHIKVVAICHVNVFYVIVFRSAAYIFPNLFQKHKYHVSGIFFSFSSGWQLPKIGGKFLKMENCFSLTNRGRSTPSSPPPPLPLPPQIFTVKLQLLKLHLITILRAWQLLNHSQSLKIKPRD